MIELFNFDIDTVACGVVVIMNTFKLLLLLVFLRSLLMNGFKILRIFVGKTGLW